MASVYKRGGKKARGTWHLSWFDHTGIRRTKSSRTTDKATAERIASKIEADVALRREGVIDAKQERLVLAGRKSLNQHVAAYRQSLETAQRSPKHITETIRYLDKIAEFAKLDLLSQFDASAVDRYIETLIDRGLGARSIQACVTAAKSFIKWAVATGRLSDDPLHSVKKPNPARDRRRLRRAILAEEWPLMLVATAQGQPRRGMTGPERALLYQIAIATGYRPGELRKLTASCVDLREVPCIRLGAGGTKNGKEAAQPIPSRIAQMLQLHCEKLKPTDPVFRLSHATKLAEVIRKDMAVARGLWVADAVDDAERQRREASDFLAESNRAGERLDFYSLRSTTATWLVHSAVDVKTAQEVLRHSTPQLTIGVYARSSVASHSGATERLGSLLNPDGPAVTAAKKEVGAQRLRQQTQREEAPATATPCDWDTRQAPGKIRVAIRRKGCLGSTLRESAPQDATPCRERRTRDSNPQPVTRQLISSQPANHSLILRASLPQPGLGSLTQNREGICRPAG